eukprot:gb/GECG01003572.1/.p1 GENE.gb/GECG01003572.1/~~gb/GECG01003572.1/.p1  ORF type:complete len:1525 (+),score=296.75 gb/GECG01003572.1/:1-4575(+)
MASSQEGIRGNYQSQEASTAAVLEGMNGRERRSPHTEDENGAGNVMQPSIPLESVSLFMQNPMMQQNQPQRQAEPQKNSLTSLVKQRLQSKEEERDALQQSRERINEKIEAKKAKYPTRQMLNEDVIDRKIAELEQQHQTTTLTNKDEREILKEIEKLKNERKKLDEFTALATEIEQLKMERGRIQEALSENYRAIGELKEAVRHSRTVDRLKELNPELNVAPEDVVTESLVVKRGSLGKIIGKGGSTIQRIESTTGVCINIDSSRKDEETATISVSAISGGLDKAKEMIEELGNSEEMTVPVSHGLFGLLSADKASLLQEIEFNHGVFANLDRENCKVVISGPPSYLGRVKEEMEKMEALKQSVTMDLRMLPSVIGKNGQGFRSVQDQCRVNLDVERDREAVKASVHIYGVSEEEVTKARELLQQLIDENTEIEKTMEVDDVFVGHLLDNSGALIKEIMRDFKIYIRARKSAVYSPEEYTRTLDIRGTRGRVEETIDHVSSLYEDYKDKFARRIVSPTVAHSIKASQGSIKDNTGASVDIRFPPRDVGGKVGVIVHGESSQVSTATEKVDEIISSFTEKELTVSGYTVSALLSRNGAVVNEIRSSTGAQINIENKSGGGKKGRFDDNQFYRITVVGTSEQVNQGEAKLQAVVEQNQKETVGYTNEDLAASFIGKAGKHVTSMNKKYPNLHIDIDRKEKEIVLRGPSNELSQAKEEVEQFVQDFESKNTVVSVDSSIIPSLIGKGGATAKQLSEDTGCQFSFDSRKGCVRIHGDSAEQMSEAVAKVKELTGEDKHFEEMHLGDDTSVLGSVIGKGGSNLRTLETEHDVKITVNRSKNSIIIRGDLENIASAKTAVRKDLRQAFKKFFELKLPVNCLDMIYGKYGAVLRSMKQATGCDINIPPRNKRVGSSVEVSVRGPSEGAEVVRKCLDKISKGTAVFVMPLLSRQIKQIVDNDSRNLEKIKRENQVDVEANSCLFTEEDGKPASVGSLMISGDAKCISKTESALESILKFYFEDSCRTVSVPTGLLYEMLHEQKARSTGSSEKKPVGIAQAESRAQAATEGGVISLSKIEERSGAILFVSFDVSQIVLAGPSSQAVFDAQKLVENEISRWSEMHAEIPVDAIALHRVIGSKGSGIDAIAAECNAKIYADRSADPPLLKIASDRQEDTQAAVRRVRSRIEEVAKVEKRVSLPTGASRIIIGPQGQTVRQLEAETDCAMGIGKEQGDLRILGPSEEAVDNAYDAVMAKLKENGIYSGNEEKEETVDVPRYMVSTIIGKGGETIRKIQRDSGANVSVDRDVGAAFIRGSEDSVQSAASMIRTMLQEEHNRGQDYEKSTGDTSASGESKQTEKSEGNSNLQNAHTDVSVLNAAEHEIQKHPPPSVPVGFGGEASKNFAKKKGKNRKKEAKEEEVETTSNAADAILNDLLSGNPGYAASGTSSCATSSTAASTTINTSPPPPPGFEPPHLDTPSEPGLNDDPISVFNSLLHVSKGENEESKSSHQEGGSSNNSGGYYVSSSGVPVRL